MECKWNNALTFSFAHVLATRIVIHKLRFLKQLLPDTRKYGWQHWGC